MQDMKHIAGGVVYNLKTDKIVVVNQNNDSWSLPKGHIEGSESPRETAIREIWEETGIPFEKLTEVAPLGFYERTRIKKHASDPNELRSITLYLYTTEHDELAPHDPQNPRAIWVAPFDVASQLTHPKDKEFFAHSLAMILRRIENIKNPPPTPPPAPVAAILTPTSNESEEEHGHQHEKTEPK